MNRLTCLAALAGTVVALGAIPAEAQDRLGSGRALDRNLQRGSGGVNPSGGDFAEAVRFRNAIVTGNAPGGRSFRGNIGYRAPGEFAGALGSDDLFSFQRDSLFSSLPAQGIRGTEALRYQFAYTTGTPPADRSVNLTVARPGSGLNAMEVTGARPMDLQADVGLAPQVTPPSQTALEDTRGMALSAMRSPSAFIATRNIQPTLLGRTTDAEGQELGVIASSLNGLRVVPLNEREFTGLEQPQEEQAKEPRPGSVPGSLVSPDRMLTSVPDRSGAAAEEQAGPGTEPRAGALPAKPGRNVFEDLRTRLAQPGEPGLPGADDPNQRDAAMQELERRLQELRDSLGRPELPGAEEEEAPDEAGDEAQPRQPGELPRPAVFDPRTLDLLRDRSGTISQFVNPAEGFDAYTEHMRRAQELLAADRYFDAEERFAAALARKPGDPMAAVGRVHAQLGAAMFLSAAVNLRTLLIEHPELAGVKYTPELLPDRQRLREIMTRLDELIMTGRGLPRDAGLLLAYIGYQIDDPTAVMRGLRAITPQGQEPQEPDQLTRLAEMLRGVWVVKPAPGAAAPAQAPAQNPPAPQAPAPEDPNK